MTGAQAGTSSVAASVTDLRVIPTIVTVIREGFTETLEIPVPRVFEFSHSFDRSQPMCQEYTLHLLFTIQLFPLRMLTFSLHGYLWTRLKGPFVRSQTKPRDIVASDVAPISTTTIVLARV
ncbi:hypothetical protein U1Q18_031324 [Sarracenia purpurea var. burkii]